MATESAIENTVITATSQAHDLSMLGLFFAADPVVKFVMLLLVGASIWCWAIIFEKIKMIRRQKKHAAAFDEVPLPALQHKGAGRLCGVAVPGAVGVGDEVVVPIHARRVRSTIENEAGVG